MHALLEDAWVVDLIDDAVAPFEDLLDRADLEWMRNQLACLLEDDPRACEALNAARPRGRGGVVDDSGEVLKPELGGVDGTAIMRPQLDEDERTG
jgi:hypothetical protein